MSNDHDPTDRQVNFWCPIVLYAQFQKKAKELGMTNAEIITAYMLKVAGSVQLSKEEYDECQRRINENRFKLSQKRTKRRSDND